ncbi:MAG: hypothetical protein ACK40G_17010 [Cytophagaceae bacterium]
MAKKNLIVLTFWSYKDALIQTYTLPYLKIIRDYTCESKIYLVTLENNKYSLSSEEKNKIVDHLKAIGIIWIRIPYYTFGMKSIITLISYFPRLLLLSLFKNVGYIQAFCTPAGALGYFLSVFSGKKLIIDSFEPHAESMVENGTWKIDSLAFKILFKLEKLQARKAKFLIAANPRMEDYVRERYGHVKAKFFFKPACVDLNLFSEGRIKNKELVQKFGFENKIVGVYAGKFGGIYLDREVFDFIRTAQNYWGDKFRFLILTSHSDEEILDFCKNAGVNIEHITKMFVPHNEIPDYLGLGDFGITPVKPVYTKRFCTPIKNGEYWALGLPVVITKDISQDSEIIKRYNIGCVIEDFTAESYYSVLNKLDEILKEDKMKLSARVRKVAVEYRSFSIANKIYSSIFTN